MKLSVLLKRINLSALGVEAEITGVSCHSSEVVAGTLFVAVKGVKADGADFAAEAVQKGAVGVISEKEINVNAPVIIVPNARKTLADIADVLYPSHTLKKAAVTGTNGKTSTVYYVAELMNAMGICTASMGTIGISSPVYTISGSMTTPDTVAVHQNLHALEQVGVQVVAMEASSHGLDQERLAGIEFGVTGFTNITQDHLDYHGNMQAYLEAKMKLFLERTTIGGTVVLNADILEFDEMKTAIEQKGLRVISYGQKGQELKLISRIAMPGGQKIEVEAFGKKYACDLNIVGDFQVSNVLCAVGMVHSLGGDVDVLFKLVPLLKAPAGRLEHVGTLKNGGDIFVDYAHTPDALERVLKTMRPHTKNRLVCVFGCGGDRDKGKRPLMGAIGQKYADVIYLTDDNPRGEDAITIRGEIKKACPKAIEIGDRHEAIATAVANLKQGDVLVIAGKGHEAGQKIGQTVYAFDDKIEVQLAMLGLSQVPLWRGEEMRACVSVDVPGDLKVYGVSIDTRTLNLGDMFVAIRGDHLDGHAYVATAVERGAAVCLVDHVIDTVPMCKQVVVPDVMQAFNQMALFARNRSEAKFIGITGSSGKTTTKEMLKVCLVDQGNTYATAGNFNNQIGVPLTLTRMPINTQYAIIEMGMNHTGELTELSKLVRPDVTIITMIGAAHLAYFKDEHQIAEAKSEIFVAQEKNGTAVLNADSPYYGFLREQAVERGIRFISSFGQAEGADFRLISVQAQGDSSHIIADWHGSKIEYKIGFLGNHFAMNSLGVLGIVDAVGASVPQAMKSLSKSSAVAGRGAVEKITLKSGKNILLIDDAYNANPSSMRASIGTLGLHAETMKVAVLGDMLELGENAIALHVGMIDVLEANHISKVYTVGSLMGKLHERLQVQMQGVHTETPEEMSFVLEKELPEGAVVLVKASNGSGLKKIISYLKAGK